MPKLRSSTLREQWVFKGGLQGSLGECSGGWKAFSIKEGGTGLGPSTPSSVYRAMGSIGNL